MPVVRTVQRFSVSVYCTSGRLGQVLRSGARYALQELNQVPIGIGHKRGASLSGEPPPHSTLELLDRAGNSEPVPGVPVARNNKESKLETACNRRCWFYWV